MNIIKSRRVINFWLFIYMYDDDVKEVVFRSLRHLYVLVVGVSADFRNVHYPHSNQNI
jgi:hypothetical protein